MTPPATAAAANPTAPRFAFDNKTAQDVPSAALRFDMPDVEIGDNGPEAKTAPVKMVARTGKPIEHWFWGTCVHDMEGMQLPKPKIAIDYCHDDDQLIGYANQFDTSTGDLVISGAIVPYAADPDDMGTEVLYKAKAGVPYEASIDFNGDGIVVEFLTPGTLTKVNGYELKGPATIFRQWPLRGVAICPHGADMSTSAQFSGPGASAGRQTTNIKLFTQETHMPDPTKPADPAPSKPADPAAPAPAAADPNKKPDPEATPAAAAPAPAAAAELSQAKGSEKFIKAFGDAGARWFLEGKKFSDCSAEFITGLRQQHTDQVSALKLSHKNETEALTAAIDDLKTKLAAAPRGNEPASFSSEGKPGNGGTGQPTPEKALEQNLGANAAKFAAGIKFKK